MPLTTYPKLKKKSAKSKKTKKCKNRKKSSSKIKKVSESDNKHAPALQRSQSTVVLNAVDQLARKQLFRILNKVNSIESLISQNNKLTPKPSLKSSFEN